MCFPGKMFNLRFVQMGRAAVQRFSLLWASEENGKRTWGNRPIELVRILFSRFNHFHRGSGVNGNLNLSRFGGPIVEEKTVWNHDQNR